MLSKLRSWEEKLYYYYSLVHIPITILIDSSVVLPLSWQLWPALVDFHVRQNNDYLLFERPLLLQIFVLIELVVQLPMFVYFAYEFRKIWALRTLPEDKNVKMQLSTRTRRLYKYLMIYGINASFTTLWCIYKVCTYGYYPYTQEIPHRVAGLPLTTQDTINLVMVYLPTFLIPARLMFLQG